METNPPGSPGAAVVESELLVASFAPDGRVTHRDPAWMHFLGEGADPWQRLVAEDQEAVRQFLHEAAGGSLLTHQVVSARLPRRDEPTPLLLNFQPVFDGAAPPSVIAVAVTGEVLAEPTTWMISQTKRHRLETLGRMTMGIAHDFNNLLSGILGHAEMLNEISAQQEAPPSIREHIDTIKRAALDGAEVVGKIQRFIRQEKKAEHEPLDVRELLNESLALTRPYWHNEPRRRGIHIELYTQFAPVPPVMGSGTELREVFVNMVLNAVQAMPSGGRLRVACEHDARNGTVAVVIEDSGLGMSEEVMARIFEPLFTTKGEHGTGMGLPVSYGIIQAHEGTVTVRSRPNRGTIFRIVLPVASVENHTASAAEAPAPYRTGRILLVDDEPMVSSILARLLERRGHAVETALSGAEAIERMANGPFDAVITDLGMPEMNGRALAEHLRRHHPALPILLLSGDTEPGTADATITEVLSKPFRIAEVEAALQRVLPPGNGEHAADEQG